MTVATAGFLAQIIFDNVVQSGSQKSATAWSYGSPPSGTLCGPSFFGAMGFPEAPATTLAKLLVANYGALQQPYPSVSPSSVSGPIGTWQFLQYFTTMYAVTPNAGTLGGMNFQAAMQYFAQTYCMDEFTAQAVATQYAAWRCSQGPHFQLPPGPGQVSAPLLQPITIPKLLNTGTYVAPRI